MQVAFETDQYHESIERLLGSMPEPGKVTVRPYNVPGSSVGVRSIQSGTIGAYSPWSH